MEGKPQLKDRRQAHPWHIGFCVFLAFLILYNPFMAICCSHGAFSVHTPQRNRATVGASELLHFGPVQEEIQQADINIEENREEVAVPAENYVARGFEREAVIPQPGFALTVWSRPPPSL